MKLSFRKLKVLFFIVTMMLLVVGSQYVKLSRELNVLKDELYTFDIRVMVVDELTGEKIQGVITHGPVVSSNDFFQQRTKFGYSGEGISEISGLAYEPRVFGFSAEGYAKKEIEINSESPGVLTVALSQE